MKQELETIRKARRSLDKLRFKLVRPTIEALTSGESDIAAAVECLQALESKLASGERRSPGIEQVMAPEIRGLRRDLQQTKALLDGAGNFYQGWARLLMNQGEGDTTAYNAAGIAGSRGPVAVSKVVLHG